jgi:hypothetical protein
MVVNKPGNIKTQIINLLVLILSPAVIVLPFILIGEILEETVTIYKLVFAFLMVGYGWAYLSLKKD